ncbi:HAD family hydrolase [Streptococcus halotolerans]|uniref:HAD family hydrolase n=1 Tax=Streptococcus halotolerans TaxID=1814128 RepID=UPI000A50EE1B|nr:HAD family hydrolase [Streptococcus halotolerans]
MIKVIYFDIDDTLYDQFKPFEDAFKTVFPHLQIDIRQAYLNSRQYSDQVFEATENGTLDLKTMHRQRIQTALKSLSLSITDDEADSFQRRYAANQRHITLDSSLRSSFDALKASGVTLGIITNGPLEHQMRKIHQLGLANWVDEDHIYISSEQGIAKPDIRLFDLARKGLYSPEDCLYIGDSFDNDVVGAKSAGWQVIWFNRRNKPLPSSQYSPDYQVTK